MALQSRGTDPVVGQRVMASPGGRRGGTYLLKRSLCGSAHSVDLIDQNTRLLYYPHSATRV
jgi:hypothetical protein